MDPAPVEDAVLIGRLQAGDESALSALMERYQNPLYYFVRRYLNDETMARDITQETFVRAYFGIGRYRPAVLFKTWLYTVAVNLCRDHARRVRRRPVLVSIDESIPGSPNPSATTLLASDRSPAANSETNERYALVEKAVATLPQDLREALLLFVFEGHSQKDCAQILGVSPKTVEMRVYHAKKELRVKLARLL